VCVCHSRDLLCLYLICFKYVVNRLNLVFDFWMSMTVYLTKLSMAQHHNFMINVICNFGKLATTPTSDGCAGVVGVKPAAVCCKII